MIRPPIPYFGGKGKFIQKLLPLIPKHHTYCEVFGGAAALLFAKHPSRVDIYNDLWDGVVNLYRVIRDVDRFPEFQRLCELTPYSRAEYNRCRAEWKTEPCEIRKAWMFFVVARQGLNVDFGHSWGLNITQSLRGMSGCVSNYLTAVDALPQIHARLQTIQIENNDFRTIIPAYDRMETFFYLDPPYLQSTRKGGQYEYEMTDSDHADLVKLCLEARGQILLSAYLDDESYPIYKPLVDAGWHRKDFQTVCHAAGHTHATGILDDSAALAKQPRRETLLQNYQLQPMLF
jgi:DNA adenine methylase